MPALLILSDKQGGVNGFYNKNAYSVACVLSCNARVCNREVL